MAEIGTALIIDKLQPKTASFFSLAARGGAMVLPGSPLLLLQVSPTALVKKAADIALKYSNCTLNLYVLEGRIGHLALSADSVSDLNAAAQSIAEGLGVNLPAPAATKIISSELISRIDHQHAYAINKVKMGSLCVPGDSVYILECQHASQALKAINEAEKFSDIKIVDARFTGSMGRLIISGEDGDVRAARDAALDAVG